MTLDRRTFAGLFAGSLLGAGPARAARTVTDSVGRVVALPDKVARVFCAGAPAAVAVYGLRPDAMVGWPRAIRAEERPYLLPAVADLPETGLLTGRGDTANVEVVLKLEPNLIVDFGSVTPTFASLADTVQARTGIPCVLIDGRFAATPSSLTALGGILDVPERGAMLAGQVSRVFARLDEVLATIPEDKRPRIYLARGPDGLETALVGSINSEIIERAGGRNVAESGDRRRGIANVSVEQVLLWNPEVIVTLDRNFHAKVFSDPLWQGVAAVKAGRVHLAPNLPFGWIDRPPSLNRIIGLMWLAHLFHGDAFPFDIGAEARRFNMLFYHVELADRDVARLIAGADGRPAR